MTYRSQLHLAALAVLMAGLGFAAPAKAQMAGGGLAGGLGPIGGVPQPRHESQSIAPPALPGASAAGNVSAGPVTDTGGDPTTLLFKAINHGDYAQARAAVSRGANLDARNALGETPIELSVELNRNRITFMLLSARAEEHPMSVSVASAPVAAVPPTTSKGSAHAKSPPFHKVEAKPAVRPLTISGDPGRPDPSAGFLGFGGSN
ncbi:ankyrin repeat domain-containing protein [Acidiphilium multivorum]|uniref:Uncharacterized protein n=4 Tax=Acidocellaceae TaxID=3385905 RepID=A5FUG0_ACICJ|nr:MULTISPECIES: ankyrin repeat domain-containing protein [Acidiphilium]ABQ29242.1 hypothetical protein Acry_0013 [Acidiphilium cryptum JF-5]MBU6355254.1 ankyrin repeat domain-containing protein [Rhodospirillales bacterium]EGO96385.1 hypothetical protein APM_0771 [Acidiphilium sp. PM]KDM68561.1 hypothetical protein ACIDI_4c01610 [Acidiphilium sp. JA12-A1]MBS3023428.1 ankyrin repeat domain-containing protein [Acidiphilium multivorum]